MSTVSIVKCKYNQHLYQNLSKGIKLAGDLDIKKEDTITIKINLCDARQPESGAITHPLFLGALLKYLRRNFGHLRIYVVESDATSAIPDFFVRWFGLDTVIKKWNAKFVNLSKLPSKNKRIEGGYLKRVPVPQILEDSYFITLPKMKTSSVTTITCCLKNQFGCLPMKRKIVFHPHIDQVIADVNQVMRPDFCVVDGILGLGGPQGPTFGEPIAANVSVAGKDPVAVDAVCSRVMGLNPMFISHIRKAARAGIGDMKYHVTGEKIKDVRTNFHISRLEFRMLKLASLMKSRALVKSRNRWRNKR
ncbi:MAG: DUF362 domain-containing protein [Candidatus Hodarchaeota archaeon]